MQTWVQQSANGETTLKPESQPGNSEANTMSAKTRAWAAAYPKEQQEVASECMGCKVQSAAATKHEAKGRLLGPIAIEKAVVFLQRFARCDGLGLGKK
jgi:hypothetical protein